eukprot:1185639-Prorocentrum_minimum.AAC.1
MHAGWGSAVLSGWGSAVLSGWGSAVRCLVSTPALDVVAIGLADGRAVLFNLRYDKVVTSFEHDAGGGAVTSIAVRSGAGDPLLVCGGTAPPWPPLLSTRLRCPGPSTSAAELPTAAVRRTRASVAPASDWFIVRIYIPTRTSGILTVWDLEQRKLHAVIKDAHDGPVSNLYFFPGEPVLLSGAADNSLKVWLACADRTLANHGRVTNSRRGSARAAEHAVVSDAVVRVCPAGAPARAQSP